MGQLQFHGMNDFLESGTRKKQALAEPCEFLCRYFTITIFLLFYYLLSQIWVPPTPTLILSQPHAGLGCSLGLQV